MKKPTLRLTRGLLLWLSGEWILDRWEVPNGGAVVFLRALLVALIIFGFALAFANVKDPTRTFEFSAKELRSQVVERLPWLGVIFAAAYTAFYTRFASQWSYLANLYNSIKQVEVSGVENKKALAEWKAGFIEDAQNLHMECKSSILSVVSTWLDDPEVEAAFIANTISGDHRLRHLRTSLAASRAIVEASYEKRLGKARRGTRPDVA